MESGAKDQISDALKQLWVKFLPQMQERVAVIDDANRALRSGSLSVEQREAAASAAHKLAGVLGTFGLAGGTSLAREAETLYQDGAGAECAARLEEIAEQLGTMISDKV